MKRTRAVTVVHVLCCLLCPSFAFTNVEYKVDSATRRTVLPSLRVGKETSRGEFDRAQKADGGITALNKKTVIIAGATGYIGRAVVAESVRRGYDTVALVRDKRKVESEEGQQAYASCFRGARIVECDVEDPGQLQSTFQSMQYPIDAIISCLASPSGTKRDTFAIDYQATLNCLQAGEYSQARHFVLLSAFCCRNPLLKLQQAKLKFEEQLQKQSRLTYSIVRPTAFLKSISGQLEAIQGGAPYVLFGNGAVTRCNPISESELAEYMMDCLVDETKHNRILNIGGPDRPLTNKKLGEMMFQAVGKPPKFVYVPTWIFDPIIDTIQFFATLLESEKLEDAAETARIGKYYAVEDMLTTDVREKYGKITVQDHYNHIAAKGQDPFTPVRATAVIGRALEVLPVFALVGVPVAYAWTKSVAIEHGVSYGDFSMVFTALSSARH